METYLVFARSDYAEPLAFQGALEVGAGQSPQGLALERFGAEWLELSLIPEGAIFWAIEAEPAAAGAEPRP